MEENNAEFALESQYLDDDKNWMVATGLDKESLKAAVEALVFLSDKPLPVARINSCVGEEVSSKAIEEALQSLREEHAARVGGIELVNVAKGWQFRTKPDLAKYARGLFKASAVSLSPATMEVLAIIAYRQPVSKTQIDEIRGVDSAYVVRGLMDKRLVRTVGRSSEELGRPTLYGTTSEFLELFNLADIEQLPPEHELQQMAEEGVGEISDIKDLVLGGEENPFFFDEVEELDNLGRRIKEVRPDTDFTKELDALKKRGKEAPPKSAFDVLAEYAGESTQSKTED